MAIVPDLYRFTIDEYYAMAEAGILRPDERLELLDGVITEMPPISNRHAATVDKFSRELILGVGNRAIVRVQGPLRVNDNSVLQPDVLVLRRRADFYASEMPGPADVLLLLEVADDSVDYDRFAKLPAYARAGIPEVWLAVSQEGRREVAVCTEPTVGGYAAMGTLTADGILTLPGFPEITLRVGEMLFDCPAERPLGSGRA